MAAVTPIAMLFVRCERGISHNPAEAVAEADVAVALDVLERFVGAPRVIDLIVRGDERDIAVEDGVIASDRARLEPAGGRRARAARAAGGDRRPRALQRPGRADWEGWATGTAALAAGGATACVEMPLNAHPPTVDGAAFDAKLAAATGRAAVDFALWGGLVPGDLDRLDELAARGVVGFKAFMCDSGIDDFQAVDDDGLGAGMQRAAVLGLPVAVHAERPSRLRAPRGGSWREWAASRPPPPSCQPSSARSSSRRKPAARCTSSTSRSPRASPRWPTRAGAASTPPARPARTTSCCAPPTWSGSARSPSARPLRDDPDELWEQLEHVTLVGSDHSPCPPAMKAGEFDTAWGGIAGAQTTLPLLLGEGLRRGVPLARLADLVTGAPAASACPARAAWRSARTPTSRWCRSAASTTVGELHDRHRANPFAGRRLGARVVRYAAARPRRRHGRLLVPRRGT